MNTNSMGHRHSTSNGRNSLTCLGSPSPNTEPTDQMSGNTPHSQAMSPSRIWKFNTSFIYLESNQVIAMIKSYWLNTYVQSHELKSFPQTRPQKLRGSVTGPILQACKQVSLGRWSNLLRITKWLGPRFSWVCLKRILITLLSHASPLEGHIWIWDHHHPWGAFSPGCFLLAMWGGPCP